MAQLVLLENNDRPREARFILRKKITTVGSEPSHDVQIGPSGLLFTILQQSNGFELMPAGAKISLNGSGVRKATLLKPCDRIEWAGGAAVYLSVAASADTQIGQDAGAHAIRSLGVLQNLASTLQAPGSLPAGFHQVLDALVEMSGAEVGYLLSDLGRDGWELVASRQDPSISALGRKELFSNTILQEALTRREPVSVENIIGHPWGEAASVIAARIFSAACVPLCVGARTLGAVFLFTRSPGRAIKRESLPELSLLATQAALLLSAEAELKTTRRENAQLRTLVTEWPSTIVSAGAASPMAEVARKISKLAPTPLSILVQGETGTGKEVVARELHRQSPRAKGAFVAVNCAAIPATLLESTLFGYERGAFTGAVRAQPGKFALADGGTLFLDEIGDLSLELQAKLLRAVQERQIDPLGSTQPVSIDVRLITATHQDLESAVRAGRFRQDLFFRLNGLILRLPPLRDRGAADLKVLADHFLRKLGSPLKLSASALQALERHSWPGNVRELEQIVTRAAFMAEGQEITPEDLELTSLPELRGPTLLSSIGEVAGIQRLQEAQLAFTRDFVERVLDRHQGGRTAAAVELGISERTLYRILSGPAVRPGDGTDSPGGSV